MAYLDWVLTKLGWTHWDKSPAYALLAILAAMFMMTLLVSVFGKVSP